MDDGSIDPRSFGTSFQAFMERMAAQSPSEEPEFRRRLRTHFGTDPATLPVVTERFATHEHVNLHIALQDTLAAPSGRSRCSGRPRRRPCSACGSPNSQLHERRPADGRRDRRTGGPSTCRSTMNGWSPASAPGCSSRDVANGLAVLVAAPPGPSVTASPLRSWHPPRPQPRRPSHRSGLRCDSATFTAGG